MKRIVTHLLILLYLLEIISPLGFIGTTFAVTDTFDFSDSAGYTLSDTTKINILGWNAKLTSTLEHTWSLSNGEIIIDDPVNIEIDGSYAYIASYCF